MVKKIKLKEGDVFAVPLLQGGYCIGIVAREYKTIRLGYFFNKVYSILPEEITKSIADINNIIFIGKFSTNGLNESDWILLKRSFTFKKAEWPIPLFKMQHPITEKYYSVLYDETLLNEERHLIPEVEAKILFAYGLSGYIALEKKLSALLSR
jgi:hypothetical protein